jgi:hypothetical protein
MRLVLAGWLSMNPSIYVLVLFAAAIALGLSTNAVLRDVGRANVAGRAAPQADSDRDDADKKDTRS